jgi:hypothetical protein
MLSASLDRRSKNVSILQVIIAELELGDIERHISSAHFVERADPTAIRLLRSSTSATAVKGIPSYFQKDAAAT